MRSDRRRLRQRAVSWILCWGIIFALTSSVDARLISLELQKNGSSRSYTHLVQRRDSSDLKRRPYDLSAPDRKETDQESACLRKIREMFPPVVLPISALDLDQARLDQREHTMIIPLREPHEDIRAIWIDADTNTEALEIMRLLRTGKIGTISVLSLGYRPSVFYMFYGVSEEDRLACQRERVLELLGTCTECEVLEWRSLQP